MNLDTRALTDYTEPVRIRCRLCQQSALPWHTINEFRLSRCIECGFIFVHPTPGSEIIQAHYDTNYYSEYASRYLAAGPTELNLWQSRADKLEMFMGRDQSLSILDIGCATGYFLETAEPKGWALNGIDHSRYATAEAQKRLPNAEIFQTDFMNFETKLEFSAITAWDVIEHISDPLNFLTKVHSHLVHKGVLAFTTVNTDSLNQRLFERKWRYYIPPEHLSYFNISNSKDALERTGFELIDYRTVFGYRAFLEGLFPKRVLPVSLWTKILLRLPKLLSERFHKGDVIEVWARKF